MRSAGWLARNGQLPNFAPRRGVLANNHDS